MLDQPAFGGMLHQLVSLGALEFRPEPLDALIERRLKDAWQHAPCPNCGEHTVQTSEDSPRIWCGNCRYTGTYTLRTPFYNSELTPGEFLIAFILYADTLLSINQIAPLLDHAYNTIHDGIRRMEAAFERGFPTVWKRIGHTIDGPTQVDETQQVCSGFKGQNPPREGLSRGGSPEGGRTRWSGEQGDELTLVAACRDVLRVVSAEEGSKYDENLGPVIEEAGDLSQRLGEVWTDELPAYQGMEHDHRTVIHDEEYVSADGVHTNQAECLWSLLQPWLAKFRGLSKQVERAFHQHVHESPQRVQQTREDEIEKAVAMVCTGGISHERLGFPVAVLDTPAIGVLTREPRDLVDDRDFARFPFCEVQIGVVGLEDDVMDAVVVDGVRLPVGRFLLRIDEVLVEGPIDRFLVIFAEDVEEVLDQFFANRRFGCDRIGRRLGVGVLFLGLVRRCTPVWQQLVTLNVGSRNPDTLSRRPAGGRRGSVSLDGNLVQTQILGGPFLVSVHSRRIQVGDVVGLTDVLDALAVELAIHQDEIDRDHFGGVFEQFFDNCRPFHPSHDRNPVQDNWHFSADDLDGRVLVRDLSVILLGTENLILQRLCVSISAERIAFGDVDRDVLVAVQLPLLSRAGDDLVIASR